jgi:hypothetical protein
MADSRDVPTSLAIDGVGPAAPPRTPARRCGRPGSAPPSYVGHPFETTVWTRMPRSGCAHVSGLLARPIAAGPDESVCGRRTSRQLRGAVASGGVPPLVGARPIVALRPCPSLAAPGHDQAIAAGKAMGCCALHHGPTTTRAILLAGAGAASSAPTGSDCPTEEVRMCRPARSRRPVKGRREQIMCAGQVSTPNRSTPWRSADSRASAGRTRSTCGAASRYPGSAREGRRYRTRAPRPRRAHGPLREGRRPRRLSGNISRARSPPWSNGTNSARRCPRLGSPTRRSHKGRSKAPRCPAPRPMAGRSFAGGAVPEAAYPRASGFPATQRSTRSR